jgi:hypothetical protein
MQMDIDTQTDQNETDIVVASISAAQLFSEHSINADKGSLIQGQLNLPEYQRPYRWSFDDVKSLLNDISAYCDDSTDNKPMFYMGSVVLHQIFDLDSSGYVLNIIDGQQRITTLSLICMAIEAQQSGAGFNLPDMEYASPVSHERIAKNYQWLVKQIFSDNLLQLDLNNINFTLVVTQSEDEAYRFFETQNTGGVRLTGPQVIKAHHLRAIPNELQSNLARKWESFNYLDEVVIRLLKARRWQAFSFMHVPSHRFPDPVKKSIVREFSENSGIDNDDMAFSRGVQNKSISGFISQQIIDGYLAKQPLNAGVNTVHYFDYFNLLYQNVLVEQTSPYLDEFYSFYNSVVKKANKSAFLTELYDISILLYVSEFGTARLIEASYWIARCVFSIRLINMKTVREDSISSFVKKLPLLDWITTAYQHDQLIKHLKQYSYEIKPENIGSDANTNGVKNKFLKGFAQYFSIDICDLTGAKLVEEFDPLLQKTISNAVTSSDVKNKEVLV